MLLAPARQRSARHRSVSPRLFTSQREIVPAAGEWKLGH